MRTLPTAVVFALTSILCVGTASAAELSGRWVAECTDDSFGTRIISSRSETIFGSTGSGVSKTSHYSGRRCEGEPVRTESKIFKYTTQVLSEADKDELETDAEILLTLNYSARSVEDGDPLQLKIGVTFIEADYTLNEPIEITFKDGDTTAVYGPDELRGRAEPTELKRAATQP